MPDNVTEDQALNDYTKANGVTEDQATNDYLKASGQSSATSFAGHMADEFFSSDLGKATKGIGRVMTSIGQGAQQGWQQGTNFEGELKKWATKSGLSKFDEEHREKGKAFNEDFIRPAIYGALRFPVTATDVASHYAMGALGGLLGGAGQTGEELDAAARTATEIPDKRFQGKWYTPLAPAMGAVGEVLRAGVSGWLPEVLPHMTAVARAKGQIGEGEAGYYNSREPSQDALQGRLSASRDAGIDSPSVEPPVTDVNLLARKIDPDTFREYDRIKELQENLRLSLKQEQTKVLQAEELGVSELHPDQVKRVAGIQHLTTRLQEADVSLRDLIPKTADARSRVEELINSDTPEGAAFRDFTQKILLENELKLAGLNDDVRLAESHARSLRPDPLNARPGELDEDTHGLNKPGSASAQNPEKILGDEPDIGHGLVRLYHGAEPGGELGGARWATTSRTRARDYGKGNRDVYYVDLPQDHHIINTIKGDKENGIPGTTHVNIPADVAKNLRALKSQVVDAEGKLVPVEVPAKLSKPSGPFKVTGPARELEQRVIEEGISGRLEAKAEYNPKTKTRQATGVQEIMDNDWNRARRIALGSEEAPDDLLRVSFARGVQERALAKGDMETIRRLANSDIFTEVSKSGQTLSLWGNNLLDDPGAILNNIANTLRERSEAATEKTMKDITKAMENIKSSIEDFIDEIECK